MTWDLVRTSVILLDKGRDRKLDFGFTKFLKICSTKIKISSFLGKTLTLIALILKQKEMMENLPDRDEKEKEEKEWLAKKSKNLIRSNGTLVICPASLMGHWDQEVKSKVRGERLSVFTYHAQGMCSILIIVKRF